MDLSTNMAMMFSTISLKQMSKTRPDIITLIENAPNWRDVIAQKEALNLVTKYLPAMIAILAKLTATEK